MNDPMATLHLGFAKENLGGVCSSVRKNGWPAKSCWLMGHAFLIGKGR